MTIKSSIGAQIAIAKTYGASKVLSVFTNAAAGVATLEASHGIIAGDVFELTSGWDYVNNSIQRALSVSTNDVTVEGLNTTNTARFPAGGGVGSIREITAWDTITQIKDMQTSGGEQQFEDITTLADFIRKQKPTVRNPVQLSLTVLEDVAAAYYATVLAAAQAGALAALRILLADGSKLYANCYWSLQTTPGLTLLQSVTAKLDITYAAEPTRFAT